MYEEYHKFQAILGLWSEFKTDLSNFLAPCLNLEISKAGGGGAGKTLGLYLMATACQMHKENPEFHPNTTKTIFLTILTIGSAP